ncbi:glutaminase A [Paraburkholderia jirisanensis]
MNKPVIKAVQPVSRPNAGQAIDTTRPAHAVAQEDALYKLFLEPGQTELTCRQIAARFRAAGILADDPRAKEVFVRLNDGRYAREAVSVEEFSALFAINPSLFRHIAEDSLVVPDWDEFSRSIGDIFAQAGKASGGKVAAYIPELARVPAHKFGLSVCSVDGQRAHFGDAGEPFSIQSISKTVSYCLASEEVGTQAIHERIGREPSGHSFNAITLDAQRRPHNPMINAGAIASCSLIKSDESASARFAHVFDAWKRLTAGGHVSFNNTVFLSERDSADRNFALAYFLRENAALSKDTSIPATLDFYFQCCSVELTCDSMAIAAATLANGGVNPLTNERVLSIDTVKNCLSLMHSCGMYDFSGEFAFLIGLPAKSGVGGGIMVVVPEVGGFCVWSPPLDEHGNSVRGIEFCKLLTSTYSFHNFDIVTGSAGEKTDPTRRKVATANARVVDLCWAAAKGDIKEIQRLVASGAELNAADYDGRTALHVAASEGQTVTVQYLLQNGGNRNAKDRWGNTPVEDARRHGNVAVAQLFEH